MSRLFLSLQLGHKEILWARLFFQWGVWLEVRLVFISYSGLWIHDGELISTLHFLQIHTLRLKDLDSLVETVMNSESCYDSNGILYTKITSCT